MVSACRRAADGHGTCARTDRAPAAHRREELRATGARRPAEALDSVQHGERAEVAQDPGRAHAWLAENVTGFTLEIEHIAEFTLMLLIGCTVSAHCREMVHW